MEEMFVKGNTRKTNIYSTAPDFIFFANYICDNWIFIVFFNNKPSNTKIL